MLCLDSQNRYLMFANAGHPLPLLIRGRQFISLNLDQTIFAGNQLGTRPDRFHCLENFVRLRPGDVLVFYTDGIIEAQNECCQTYQESFEQKLLAVGDHTPAQIIAALQQDFAAFRGSTPLTDDITMIVIRV